ncbi:LLM class flavin-dependent oxidoreductase [Yinghuangia aomiensis]
MPSDFDALVAAAIMGARTRRIELGTAVVPLQAQHPIALARQALSAQGAARGPLHAGVGPSHHWDRPRHAPGCRTTSPPHTPRDYLDVLNAALRGPGPVDVENGTFYRPQPDRPRPRGACPGPAGRPRAGQRCGSRRGAGRRHRAGGWRDGRAVADHVAHARITKSGRSGERQRRGSSPAFRSAWPAPRPRSTQHAGGPTASSARPRSRRTTGAPAGRRRCARSTSATCAPRAARR